MIVYLPRRLVDHNLMVPRLHQPTAQVLELFASLHEQVTTRSRTRWLREAHRDALAGVTCPDVQAWITGATVDSEEVQVGMEASKNGVLLSVLAEIRCSGRKEVRAEMLQIR